MFFGTQRAGFIEVDYHDWGEVLKETFEKVKQAIVSVHEISFEYVTAQNQKSIRTVEPYILWFKDKTWYLKAYCLEKKEKRIFRLSRMRNVEILNKTYAIRMLDWKETKEQKNSDEIQKNLELLEIDLWIAKEMEHRVLDEFMPKWVKRTTNGDFIVRLSYRLDEWVYGYICSFGPYAKVLKPSFVQEEIKNRFKTAYQQYQKEEHICQDQVQKKI